MKINIQHWFFIIGIISSCTNLSPPIPKNLNSLVSELSASSISVRYSFIKSSQDTDSRVYSIDIVNPKIQDIKTDEMSQMFASKVFDFIWDAIEQLDTSVTRVDIILKMNSSEIAIKTPIEEVYSLRGNKMEVEGNYKEALKLYTKSIALQPTNAIAYAQRGGVYFHLGEFDNAIQDLEKAINYKPNDKHIINNLGVVFYTIEDYKTAEKIYYKSLEIDSSFLPAYAELGKVYYRQKLFDKAIEFFNKSLIYNNLTWKVWLSKSYIGKNELDSAGIILNEVIKEDSLFGDAYRVRGLMFLKQNKNERACIEFQKALDLGDILAKEEIEINCR